MVSELWFSRLGGQIWAAAVEDGRIAEIHAAWPTDDRVRAGSIHLAKVRRIVPQLGAAFVALEGGEGYLEAADLPGEGDPAEKLAALEGGSELVVQVRREARRGKRARVTAGLELVGPHMALRPTGTGAAVSRRIDDDAERERLQRWATSTHAGRVVLRTAARRASSDTLDHEHARLASRAANLAAHALEITAPRLLEPAPGLVEGLIRDFAGRSLNRILVESEADADAARKSGASAAIEFHASPTPLIHAGGLWATVETALETRVQLDSGASLAIETTEALWAIDVNAAAARGPGGSAVSTVAINLEAAGRIAAEIRLRDIAGTILVDFLDHACAADREAVTARFRQALRPDRRYLRISCWTGLGLCELARRRVGPGLLERLGPSNAPTAWGRAARVLADLVTRPVAPRGYVATVDPSTAAALTTSIETAPSALPLRVVIDERIDAGHRLERA